jgi:RNA polymerase sigma-70 factor (ECF subfamily)
MTAALCQTRSMHSIVLDHRRELVSYAAAALQDHALAEDVVQESLVRAWRHCHAYDPAAGTVRTWLYAIVRNKVVDAVRARRRRPLVPLEAATDPADRDDIAFLLDELEVRRSLGRLRPEHRAVVDGIYLRDLAYEDLAAELGIPVGTVKSRVFSAIRALRADLTAGRPASPASRGSSGGRTIAASARAAATLRSTAR